MINLEKLYNEGWIEIEGISSKDDLVAIAKQLGSIIPHPNGDLIFSLTPTDGKKSIKGSFSNIYGFSEFPLHTDTAFWALPVRYIVMGMIEQSCCNTKILNIFNIFSELCEQSIKLARNSIYMISTIEGKKYTSVYFKSSSCVGFRFDPNCMVPINHSAKMFHKEFIKFLVNPKTNSIVWSGYKAIVIDNWNILHGRGSVSDSEKNRKLLRIYVG